MKKTIIPVLLLSLFFACCSDDKSPSSPDDDEKVSSSSQNTSDTKKKSSSSKGKSSSSVSSSSTKKSSSSSFDPSDVYRIEPSTVTKGTITDSRDGRTYRTVTIGTQTWMAENLNYETETSVCADTTDSGCKKYGRNYYWSDVIASENSGCTETDPCEQPFKGLCPEGYRVPTNDDWTLLLQKVSIGKDKDNNYLEAGYRLYSKEDGGSDVYGFSAHRAASSFWTSAHFNYGNVYYHEGYRRATLVSIGSMVAYTYGGERVTSRRSLRCILDDRPVQDLNDPSTIKSKDENCKDVKWNPKIKPCNIGKTDNCEYGEFDGKKTVKIGNQIWMKYKELARPLFSSEECPSGWTVADSTQWQELIDNVGGYCFAGKMLKSTSGWEKGNGLNAYGFNLKPTGYQSIELDYEKSSAYLGRDYYAGQSSTPIFIRKNFNTTYDTAIKFSTDDGVSFSNHRDKSANIFCIKSGPAPDISDSLLNPNFEYGEFTDSRDGQTYKTTIIGSQKWMAQNLNYKTDSSIYIQDHVYSDYSNSFGRLYTFEEANEICPAGWHLPEKADFDTLISIAAPNHKTKELVSKYYGRNDAYGFSIGFGGYAEARRKEYNYIYYSRLYHKGERDASGSGYFWSSSMQSDSIAYILFTYIGSMSDSLNVGRGWINEDFHSVRCINDTLFKEDNLKETEEESK